MSISPTAKKSIEELIDSVVLSYISRSTDKPKKNSNNPFVSALLGNLDSVTHRIHGLKTAMGSQMEKVAEIIARDAYGADNIVRKVNRNVSLPKNVFQTIDSIINELSNSETKSDYKAEVARIKEACKNPSKDYEEHTYEFDLEIHDKENNTVHFLEMKGPDPNTTEVPGAKKRLLAELAWGILNAEESNVESKFAIYYNNQSPKPYTNPKVLYYFNEEGLLVQEDFWNFIGKNNQTYKKLVKIFDDFGEKKKDDFLQAMNNLLNG